MYGQISWRILKWSWWIAWKDLICTSTSIAIWQTQNESILINPRESLLRGQLFWRILKGSWWITSLHINIDGNLINSIQVNPESWLILNVWLTFLKNPEMILMDCLEGPHLHINVDNNLMNSIKCYWCTERERKWNEAVKVAQRKCCNCYRKPEVGDIKAQKIWLPSSLWNPAGSLINSEWFHRSLFNSQ